MAIIGYKRRYLPKHPMADSGGYLPEARLLMAAHLGRTLDNRKEHVHHKDGNRHNNALSNLEVLTPREHRRVHEGWKLIEGQWWKFCYICRRFMPVENNFYRRRNHHSEFMAECKQCDAEKARQARINRNGNGRSLK